MPSLGSVRPVHEQGAGCLRSYRLPVGDWGSGVQISPLRPMKSKSYALWGSRFSFFGPYLAHHAEMATVGSPIIGLMFAVLQSLRLTQGLAWHNRSVQFDRPCPNLVPRPDESTLIGAFDPDLVPHMSPLINDTFPIRDLAAARRLLDELTQR